MPPSPSSRRRGDHARGENRSPEERDTLGAVAIWEEEKSYGCSRAEHEQDVPDTEQHAALACRLEKEPSPEKARKVRKLPRNAGKRPRAKPPCHPQEHRGHDEPWPLGAD